MPLLYVRGNHDRGGGWVEGKMRIPRPIDEHAQNLLGVRICGLSWPGGRSRRAIRDDQGAWGQSVSFWLRTLRQGPQIIVSHVPPLGIGDTPEDYYHRGFAGYRWLLKQRKPVLWLHGHTSLAATPEWKIKAGNSLVVNVTGGVLIELGATQTGTATIGSGADERGTETS